MKDALRIKYLNPLARIEQELEDKEQGELRIKKIKYKMKSINAFALNETSFYPHLPHQKNEQSGSTLTSPKHHSNQSVEPLFNPENEEQRRRLGELVNNQQGAIDPQQAPSKALDQTFILKLGGELLEEEQKRSYCHDCDSTFGKELPHYCLQTFSSLQAVDRRFQQLLQLMSASQSEKFLFLAQYSLQLEDSAKIIAILQLLRGTGRVQLSVLQQVMRRRLINICSKKLAFVLQREEE